MRPVGSLKKTISSEEIKVRQAAENNLNECLARKIIPMEVQLLIQIVHVWNGNTHP